MRARDEHGEPVRSIDDVSVTRVRPRASELASDHVAVEEPLEIAVAGEVLATTMRTPGHDRELVLGFLFAEGVIQSAAQLTRCEQVDVNRVDVTLASGAPESLALPRRGTLTTSACGVCGRRGIDDLLARVRVDTTASTCSARVLRELPRALAARQPIFALTGGVHAAGLAAANGELLCVREDVGRHNAVDKAVGELLQRAEPPLAAALVVSGRVSFEIVQKAAAAGVAAVVAVSAPSSLAIRVAERARLLLVAFARDGAFNVYAGSERLEHER